jgi:hypothetical protein
MADSLGPGDLFRRIGGDVLPSFELVLFEHNKLIAANVSAPAMMELSRMVRRINLSGRSAACRSTPFLSV